MPTAPMDWTSVNWVYVILLALFVFFSTLVGNLISFRRALPAAVLSALFFAAGFIFWTYYPHGLPLPINPTAQETAGPTSVIPQQPPAATLSAPVQPDNPARTTTPPAPNPQ